MTRHCYFVYGEFDVSAFMNRQEAYDCANHIGLILFSNDVEEACELTPIFENFRDATEHAHASGDTKLYDAIDQACDKLVEWKKKHKKAALRILSFSDGKDTNSTKKPHTLAAKLQKHQIVADAIWFVRNKKCEEENCSPFWFGLSKRLE